MGRLLLSGEIDAPILLVVRMGMTPISQRFPTLTDPEEFQRMCRDVLRQYWSRPGMEVFGKRGEKQYGIDILDLGGENPLYAAQCKLREDHKALSAREIQDEVDKAKTFPRLLGKYGILTTAKTSTEAQMQVRTINEAHKAAGLFEVELLAWEQLCPLIQKYSDVQEHFYGDIPPGRARRIDAQLVAILDGIQSLTSQAAEGTIDAEINEARDCIDNRDFEMATMLLNRLQRDKGDRLDARQRFRVLSNLGAASFGRGKLEEAASYFFRAAEHQPDDERARTNAVLGHFLVGEFEVCHAKAAALRTEYPTSARLAALWVLSAPRNMLASSLASVIDEVLRTDPEVSIALARRALLDLDFALAARYAEAAEKDAHIAPQAHLVQAQIKLGVALHTQFGLAANSVGPVSTFSDAEAAASVAIEKARAENDHQTERLALVQRMDVRLLQKDINGAIADAEAAEKLDPEDPQVMLATAQIRLATSRADEGIAILRKARRLYPDPNIAFLYGRALFARGQSEDVDEALATLLPVSMENLRPDLRATFATQVFQCFAKKNDWAGAQSYLEGVVAFLDPIIVETIRGYLAHYQGKRDEAERHALGAKNGLTSTGGVAETKAYLARLLMLIGRPADALPLWQDLFDSGDPLFDPGHLLNCAAQLRRDDLVMHTCDQLHARGVGDWHLLEFEVSYLQKYKIDLAIRRLQTFIAQNPDHKLAKLRLSLIGLGLNRPELVSGAPTELPPPEELPIEYIVPAVQVMRYGGYPNQALDYAYRFLRNNFNDVRAHQALLVSVTPDSSAPDIPPMLDVAGPDAAVCYKEIPRGTETWVVLENTDKPNRDFEEIAVDSPLGQRLCGKRVGENVVIAPGSIQDRTARIIQIVPKYVRRYQDSMTEMQVRFGAASCVESIQIERPDDPDPRKALDVIFASVEKRAAAAASVRDAYNTLPASLHWFGSRFGDNAYTALIELAAEDGQNIRCTFGTAEERDHSARALQAAKGVVVDLTALATLRLLGLEKVLESTKFHFIVSERTWVTLQEMLFNARIFSGTSGALLFKDGKHVYSERSAEEKAQQNKRDADFISFLERVVQVKSAPGLAALEPDKREAFEKFFGNYGAESIVLASDPELVLWTDDLVQAQTAQQEFGCRRVWTQLVLGALADAGLITIDEYSDASARLLAMGFGTTQFDSLTILAALRLAKWSPDTPPFTQIVKIFSDPTSQLPVLMRIFVEFLVRLYREPITPEMRCSATQQLLSALAIRGKAGQFLTSLRELSSRIFGLNEVGRNQFEECFDRWMRYRNADGLHLT